MIFFNCTKHKHSAPTLTAIKSDVDWQKKIQYYCCELLRSLYWPRIGYFSARAFRTMLVRQLYERFTHVQVEFSDVSNIVSTGR